MRIVRDIEAGHWNIAALTEDENKLLRPFVVRLQQGASFLYEGRAEDPDPRFVQVILNAGGEERRKVEVDGNCRHSYPVTEGGISVRLAGSTDDDKHALFQLRDCFYWGGMKPSLKDASLDSALVSFRIPGKPCKHCGAPMVTMGRCEWNTCESCADKCEHMYERGVVHGGGTDIGMGDFCQKCGQGRPEPTGKRKKSVLEHHLAVVRETGAHVVYQDGPVDTPDELVKLKRAVRRFRQSKTRALKKHKK